MPSDFDLVITADYPSRTAELRLLDEHGSQLAFRQTDFKTIAAGRQHPAEVQAAVDQLLEQARQATLQ